MPAPFIIPPKRSLGIFQGLGDVLDARDQRAQQEQANQDKLALRLQQQADREAQARSRTIEDALHQAQADALTKKPGRTIVGEVTDPVSGQVYNRYSDGTAEPVKLGGTAQAPGVTPTTAPQTLRVGTKPKEPVLKEVGGDLYDVTDPKKPVLVQQGKPPKDPTEGKPTEAQQKAVAFNHRVIPAGQRLNAFDDRQMLDVVASKAGLFGNWAKSPEGRQLEQAGRTWVQSVLRPESGATITPSEMEEYQKTYLPMPNDDETTLAQKRQARREAEEGVSLMAGKFLPKGAPTSAIQADSLAGVSRQRPANGSNVPTFEQWNAARQKKGGR